MHHIYGGYEEIGTVGKAIPDERIRNPKKQSDRHLFYRMQPALHSIDQANRDVRPQRAINRRGREYQTGAPTPPDDATGRY